MQSIIEIKDLKINAKHGVLDFEKTTPQLFVVNAQVFVDFLDAARIDDLNKSISYCDLMQDINDFVINNTFNLIETLSYKLALFLLNKYDKISAINLSIDKPNAPCDFNFNSVSADVNLKWHDVYLSLGSNLGDRALNLSNALKLLETNETHIVKQSSILYNEPYGGVADQEFANMCIKAKTVLSPIQLLDEIHKIEDALLRVREKRWGNRNIDIDIIFYDDITYSSDILTIPHKDYKNRDFVLIPLKEIAPNLD